ncbi:hypothetical protein AMS68_004509 [Peltaster fructicola]|uniref:Uncharacterized protein n=1 Tax=Peltaster fructicola TaxID=286661 RepID=A0A6H0XW48_9PEZI|nr:hypothetical protein AMS68_004509 [Peltaster fructicola]
MARKARQRISYVLPLPNSSGGHRLGVNGLAIDSNNSILYSGGRDGVICAWDLGLDLTSNAEVVETYKPPPTTIIQQVQAHTHWINDIALAQSNSVLLTASSDITVKCWRPTAHDNQPPQSIGLHTDYVKVLAVPSPTSPWVASGGLDRKINVWDLTGAGQKLSIDVGGDEARSLSTREKGSIYALAATNNVICSGGPESTVRVWDARTGRRITKLVGHTDNIRDLLVSQDGSTILTASSDRTVKVWSTIAGRCLYTLTMHDASIWSLYSADPDLSVFYSSDKNGLVAKTDTRNTIELDEGLSVAICQEHEGAHTVKAAGGYVWTATCRPSINRWRDVNTTDAEIDVPETHNTKRRSVKQYASHPSKRTSVTSNQSLGEKKIALKHMLRLSNTAYFPLPADTDIADILPNRRISTYEKPSQDLVIGQPIRAHPDYTTEGQNGLIKHVMLNDRKRILTLDTAGEVVMWDLLKCVPIKSFGKQHIEDVHKEFLSDVAVTNWCTVNTRTGYVAVVLEEQTCFDAEIYADELELDQDIEFKDDQRINLGKWVLRYLFSNVISEEIERDQVVRQQLLRGREQSLQRDNAPASIQIPTAQMNGWHADGSAPGSATTLRATNGLRAPITPGIVAATPAPAASVASDGEAVPSTDDNPRASVDKNRDYFTTMRNAMQGLTSPNTSAPLKSPTSPSAEPDTDNKDTGLFGKKFRVGRSFPSMKKLGRSLEKERPSAVEEKDEHESDSRSSQASSSRHVDDNFLGAVQKIRFGYEDSLQAQVQSQQAHENGLPGVKKDIELPTAITPSLPAETPVLKPPANTIILIQEEQPEAGGVADLLESTVGEIGQVCDQVEKAAPVWLADVLLRNQIPAKEIVKISFVLEPYPGSGLPEISSDNNNRLNANRMLRARKILAYVAERIEPQDDKEAANSLRPDEYLELWCQGQRVPNLMTLMTIRVQLWRSSNDIVLMYKANGQKAIKHVDTTVASKSSIPVATPS